MTLTLLGCVGIVYLGQELKVLADCFNHSGLWANSTKSHLEQYFKSYETFFNGAWVQEKVFKLGEAIVPL